MAQTNLRPAYSVALPPSKEVTAHARAAAELGYSRVWIFDSPSLYGDVWVALARIAESVPGIGLATGVAVPSLRHPMVTASAIATIEELSPGRLWAYFGTGFTARFTMGKPSVKWADLATYVEQVRGLLRGDVVEIDGAACQMIHSPGWGPPRPITVPLGLAPIGPKGFAVSRQLADGVILTAPAGGGGSTLAACGAARQRLRLGSGRGPRQPPPGRSGRAGVRHGLSRPLQMGPRLVRSSPGGSEWLERLEAERPESERHLAVHEGHLVTVTERDRPLLEVAGERILGDGLDR